MATVDGPMVIRAATKVVLRPARSPKCPKRAAPTGRAKKARAKVASDCKVAVAGSLEGKEQFGKHQYSCGGVDVKVKKLNGCTHQACH